MEWLTDYHLGGIVIGILTLFLTLLINETALDKSFSWIQVSAYSKRTSA